MWFCAQNRAQVNQITREIIRVYVLSAAHFPCLFRCVSLALVFLIHIYVITRVCLFFLLSVRICKEVKEVLSFHFLVLNCVWTRQTLSSITWEMVYVEDKRWNLISWISSCVFLDVSWEVCAWMLTLSYNAIKSILNMCNLILIYVSILSST